jgi:hypothetical protein
MTQRPHPVTRLTRTARGMRLAANMWPPLLFAGIRVEHIAADFRHVRVRLAKSPLTLNYSATSRGRNSSNNVTLATPLTARRRHCSRRKKLTTTSPWAGRTSTKGGR